MSEFESKNDLLPCPCCKHPVMELEECQGDLGGPELDGWYIVHGWETSTIFTDCPLKFGPVETKEKAIEKWNMLPR
ncbi:MAG: hypothetical protein WA066_02735 [Candidatus Omnitrophota bacterium]